VHDWESDIATTLIAFRDRLNVFTRDVVGGLAAPTINFRDSFADPFDAASNRSPPAKNGVPPGADPTDPADNTRHGASGIMALRETPGFVSLGELTLLRDFGYAADPSEPLFPHDIDRLGYDDADVDQAGVDPTRYGATAADDGIEDDFDERLAIASAVMNSASIRSDTFAVWFIIHGYQESDTTGLTDEDPLIPTIARRFVMVVDRSNVTQPGEKPKIVLFKEVPL
jgi:hypothetical protein